MYSFINRLVVAINLIILLFILADARNVQDASGKRVINGGTYYIRTNNPGPYDHTTITWAYNASTPAYLNYCPLYVTQNSTANTTAIISCSMTMSKYIPLGLSIAVSFIDNNTPCNIPLSWSAMPAIGSKSNILYVVAGYQLASYDEGAFEILDAKLKQKNVYKLRYCTEDEGCMNVGWIDDGSGSPYLAMTMDSNVRLDTFYFVLE